jgi:hypothetical protein
MALAGVRGMLDETVWRVNCLWYEMQLQGY